MAVNFWLVKSEPENFSFEDLKNSIDQTTCWDGVRNYQARNYMRDQMKKGDKVLFYHSNTDPNIIAGYCTVIKEGYPDSTAFNPEDKHYDPKSKPDEPTWYMIDLKIEKEFTTPVTLSGIKTNDKLTNMKLLQKGNRLSVMPVMENEFFEIIKMASVQ